jgi:hypothetical protein
VHPVLDRDRLLTYLESYTSPRKQPEALSGEQDRIPHHRLLGQAFGALLEHLDLGRTRRLYSPTQRKAMRLRDQHCRAEDCTTPAAWCEAHHLKPWTQGGNTNLDDGILACNWHHHRLHDPRYGHELIPNGDLRFHRRR